MVFKNSQDHYVGDNSSANCLEQPLERVQEHFRGQENCVGKKQRARRFHRHVTQEATKEKVRLQELKIQQLEGRVVQLEASLKEVLEAIFPCMDVLMERLEVRAPQTSTTLPSSPASNSFPPPITSPLPSISLPTTTKAKIVPEERETRGEMEKSFCAKLEDVRRDFAPDFDGYIRDKVRSVLHDDTITPHSIKHNTNQWLVNTTLSNPLRDVSSAAADSASSERRKVQGEELLAATSSGRTNDARRLLDAGAYVHYRDRGARTALHWAADKAHAELVSLLLERGADVHAEDIRASTALHLAAGADRKGCCVRLLVDAGADVHSQDHCGATPLHKAAMKGNETAARALLAAGANKAVEENRGRTPFHFAQDGALRRILRT